jgi:hypothetical protein
MEKEEKYITLIDGIEPLLAYKDRFPHIWNRLFNLIFNI